MFPNRNQFLQPLWHNGPLPGDYYSFPSSSQANEKFDEAQAMQRSYHPVTTGTSVVGLKFKDGVMIAADNLVSYGSTAKFPNTDRVFAINDHTILGAGGDYADFQYLKKYIDQKTVEDICYDDNNLMKPKSLYNWLTRILYNRRNRFNPLWLDIVVGGLEDGVPFLGHIDLRGKSYQADVIASGFGRYIALPFLRTEHESDPNLSQEKAGKLMHKSMEILFYRDCRAFSEYNLAICNKDGSVVKGPFDNDQDWTVAKMTEE